MMTVESSICLAQPIQADAFVEKRRRDLKKREGGLGEGGERRRGGLNDDVEKDFVRDPPRGRFGGGEGAMLVDERRK